MKSVLLTRLSSILTYFSPITSLFIVVAVVYYVSFKLRRQRLEQLMAKIPGPVALPIIGNTLEINIGYDELFSRLIGVRHLWGRKQGICKAWLGQAPYVFLSDAKKIEIIMGSPKHIDKSNDYNFLMPWLGTGLLTSRGQKWHSRRKILTPAFHFKILEDFHDVFQEQSAILVKKLAAEVDTECFNIFSYVTLCTLDIICETAMGRSINAQNDKESEYVNAVYKIGEIIQKRQAKLWLQSDAIFRLTSLYKEHQGYIDILHGYSYRVIHERREEIKNNNNNNYNNNNYNNNNNNMDDMNNNNNNEYVNLNSESAAELEKLKYDVLDFPKKKRLAFLDLLIEASQDGAVLSTDDIREEVDTFMFEGHDTTSASVCWTLFLLGGSPDIQDKVLEEIDMVLGGDRERSPTMKELGEMKYLECVIKESLRLYPSVPLIARSLGEDVNLGDYTVPAGVTAMIATYVLHRDPAVFPKPEQFNPDNFLQSNIQGRNPYAYIPFSAGPRNCIGQKFATLEEKSIISAVIRNYVVEAVDRREDLTLLGELILRPKNGLRMRITPRKPY